MLSREKCTCYYMGGLVLWSGCFYLEKGLVGPCLRADRRAAQPVLGKFCHLPTQVILRASLLGTCRFNHFQICSCSFFPKLSLSVHHDQKEKTAGKQNKQERYSITFCEANLVGKTTMGREDSNWITFCEANLAGNTTMESLEQNTATTSPFHGSNRI